MLLYSLLLETIPSRSSFYMHWYNISKKKCDSYLYREISLITSAGKYHDIRCKCFGLFFVFIVLYTSNCFSKSVSVI